MIGEKVSHYRIIEKLGSGGMGLIYKAQDLKLDRAVALKFLPPVFSMNEDFKQSILEEAKIAATLDHPNICNIHEVGETEDEQIFIVMSYYEGETLREKIENNSVPKEDIESIILQIAKGLEKAHEKRIIHRDIKPENIFITKQNEVKILDFGVAKIAGDYSVIDSDRVKGTLAYMSPEQISGKSTDNRTDIWALGVLLYELITGKKPFSCEYVQSALYSIINDEPDLSIIQEKTELQYLKEIIAKCLEKKKEDRYKSVSLLIESLEQRTSLKKTILLKYYHRKLTTIVISLFILALIGTIIYPLIVEYISKSSSSKKIRIAILPFNNRFDNESTDDLPMLIQSLLVSELSRIRQIGIIDPNSLNGFWLSSFEGLLDQSNITQNYKSLEELDVSLIIDGAIIEGKDKHEIRIKIIEPNSSEIKFTFENAYENDSSFFRCIKEISNQITNYFYVELFPSRSDEDLKPWVSSGTKNMFALKSFLQASQLIFRFEPGSTKHLRQSIAYDSTYISPRIWLISSLVSSGNYEEAKEHLSFLNKHEPNANPFEQSMIRWASGYIENDIPQQIQYLSLALEFSPNNNIILYNLARLYCMLGDYNSAIESLEDAIDMKWKYSIAYAISGYCYYKLKNYDKAIEVLENSLSIEPTYEYIFGLLSILSLIENDTINSKFYEQKYISRSIEIGISKDKIFSNIADLYNEESFNENAVVYYKKAIMEDTTISEYHDKLANCYITLNDIENAKSEYIQSILLDSLSENSHYMLGNIYLQLKQFKKANLHFLSFLKIDSISERTDTARIKLLKINEIIQK